MKLLRRKASGAKEDKAVPAKGGRALVVYFIPLVLVGLVLAAVVSFFVQQALNTNQRDLARQSAAIVSAAVVERITGLLRSQQDMLLLMARQGRLVERLAGRTDGGWLELDAESLRDLPGFLSVRLFPASWSTPVSEGDVPIGYAGIDLIRNAAATGYRQAAEVHQISAGNPYIAIAVPVQEGDRVVAVLFGAMSADVVRRVVTGAPDFPGRLWLVQGGGEGFTLATGQRGGAATVTGSVPVDGSIWKLNYLAEPEKHPLSRGFVLHSVLAGGVGAMLLALVLVIRLLSRDLREDQASIVALAEAILGGEGATMPKPRIAANRDALILLTQYAKDALGHSRAGRQETRKPAPGTSEPGQDEAEEELPPMGATPPPVSRETLQRSMTASNIDESMFRAYDVRGVVGDALTAPVVRLCGQAIGTRALRESGSRVAVARDARLSSPELAEAMIEGLQAAGCEVSDLGMVPTPVMYFAVEHEGLDAGVMITGSHNPPEYNGFKVMVGGHMLGGEDLLDLRRMMIAGDLLEGQGEVVELDALPAYVAAVAESMQIGRPLKVVIDAGNGAAGEAAKLVFAALGCEVVPLFCEPDGNFPNHHPDPGQPDNIAALMVEVQAREADLGIAFDGDGDRVGLVDNRGSYVWPDHILMLLAADILVRNPGADILYDVKSSKNIAGFLLANGGRPIMWKAGHTLMKEKMKETGALLAGEFSGHFFIAERWSGFDDGIYTAARVVELLTADPREVADVFGELPRSPATPEIYLDVGEGNAAILMQSLGQHMDFEDARVIDIDGIRVEFPDSWGLVRASNTTPSLMFRFEADDETALDAIKARFRDLLKRVLPDARAPF